MSPVETALEITPALLIDSSPFLRAIVQQIRANDAYGTYRNWSDDLLLKPYLVSKADKRDIPLEDEVDAITQGRILAFYRAIAYCLEQETGLLSQVVLDLKHEGFGWAIIFAGRLLLVCKTLRDAQRFGFPTLEKMAVEGEKLIQKGIELAKKYPAVGGL
jgi:probable nitrogen fixation protein